MVLFFQEVLMTDSASVNQLPFQFLDTLPDKCDLLGILRGREFKILPIIFHRFEPPSKNIL